jgi:hypothetical protein
VFAFAGFSGKENGHDLVRKKRAIVDRHLVYFAMHPPYVAIRTRNSAHEKRGSTGSINLIILPPGYRDAVVNETGKGVALRAARYSLGVGMSEY